MDELLWVRSFVNETYLWPDEVPDPDPAGYSDPQAYFSVLKTSEITASGKQKDEFSWSQDAEQYYAQVTSEVQPSYGLTPQMFVVFDGSPPRDVQILFTEPDSPASADSGLGPKLRRGTKLIEIDGADIVNGDADAANAALYALFFPENIGDTIQLVVQHRDSASTETITMTAEAISEAPVNRTAIVDTPTGKVGYILLNTFGTYSAERAIYEAINQLDAEGVTDLVLDLRYNGGGFVDIAAELGYQIAGSANTAGYNFGVALNNQNQSAGVWPFQSTALEFDDLPFGTPLSSLDLDRVYILTSDNTCSASEMVINGLDGADIDVYLFGGRSCGKPYGFAGRDNCGVVYLPLQYKFANHVGFGDYADGFKPATNSTTVGGEALPGCDYTNLVDTSVELGDPNELLFAAALEYRASGTCLSASSSSSPQTRSITKRDAATQGDQRITLPELPETRNSALLNRRP